MGLDYLGLEKYHNFILWEQRNGDKIPLHWRTGRRCNPHLPDCRTDVETAVEQAEKLGLNVGFVITEGDDLFFLDLDACYDGEVIRPECAEIIDLFKGTFMETSVSGEGIHIIGRYDPAVIGHDHRCKSTDGSFDALFTRSRFVALTMRDVRGRVAPDMSAVLRPFIDARLGPDDEGVRPEKWTTEPVRGGIESDTEVISRACDARSAARAFDGVTFTDLWNANGDKLRMKYPPVQPDDDGWDDSAADAALAQHLAFWTGGCCDQILRIMLMCDGLRRPKWEREDYLERTILRAVARQDGFYGDRNIAVPVPKAIEFTTPVAVPVEGARIMTAAEQMEYFAGCVYVMSVNRILDSKGFLMKPDAFRAWFGGYRFSLDGIDKFTTNAFKAFTESQCISFPKVRDMMFDPSLPPHAIIDGRINTFITQDVICVEGDVTPFLRHVEKMLPDETDRNILLDYLAACVQRPGDKFQWAPLIQGTEGNGKTLLATALRNAIGRQYFHQQDPEDLGNVFNAWVERSIMVCVEEVFVNARYEMANRMKAMITNDWLPLHAKGMDQRSAPNCAKFILFSNHRDGVLKHADDRRYAVFYTAQQSREDKERDGMTNAYFEKLYNWINSREGKGAVTWYLHNREVKTGMMGEAPVTTSTPEAFFESLGAMERLTLEAINRDDIGFRGGMAGAPYIDSLLRLNGYTKTSPKKRHDIMRNIGYRPLDGIDQGRIRVNGEKMMLFVRKGHPVSLLSPQAVRDCFLEQNKIDI